MEIVFESIVIACLVCLAACAIVFPILFLVQFSRFRKEVTAAMLEIKRGDEKKEEESVE